MAVEQPGIVDLRGAEDPSEADITDIWVAGMPFGKLVETTHERGKEALDAIGERPPEFDDATLWAIVQQQQAEIERLERKLDEQAAKSGMTEQKRERVDRIEDLVEYAYQEGRGGSRGVSLESPLVAAVTGVSRSKATEHIGDVAAVFPWADKKDAHGPNPMELRIDTEANDLDDVLEEVRTTYSDR